MKLTYFVDNFRNRGFVRGFVLVEYFLLVEVVVLVVAGVLLGVSGEDVELVEDAAVVEVVILKKFESSLITAGIIFRKIFLAVLLLWELFTFLLMFNISFKSLSKLFRRN